MENIIQELKEIIKKYKNYIFEFKLNEWETDFLRFYKSQTNYNISKKVYCLKGCMVKKNKKKYNFNLTNPTIKQIIASIEAGIDIIDSLPKDPFFVNFEDNLETYNYSHFDSSIEKISLDKKVEILNNLSNIAKKYDFDIYGTFITLKLKSNILNSNGLDKLFYYSPVMLDVKAMSNKNMVTIINSFGGNDLTKFDFNSFSQDFEQKIKYAQLDIIDIEPGEYEAILSPHAVFELTEYLTYGAYGENLDSNSSFFINKLDQKIFPDFITISSAPNDERVINFPYNEDGHLAKDIKLIENGIFKNFIINKYYSHKLNMKNSGSVGVKALIMEPGDKSLDDMIKTVKKGIYISNLHYMNFINEKETSVTGLTRDGTFLIEDGKITKVINNLRYTEKISEIFENIKEIENKNYTIPKSENYDDFNIYSGSFPHIKTSKFKISSSTKTI